VFAVRHTVAIAREASIGRARVVLALATWEARG